MRATKNRLTFSISPSTISANNYLSLNVYHYYHDRLINLKDISEENNMIVDALRWNMLNVVRVELVFNAWKIWKIFRQSSLQSTRGQYAIISMVITLLAMLTIQFNFGWLLTMYSVYLATGMCVWLHRRVYFYHRRLDATGISTTIQHFDTSSSKAINGSFAAAHLTGTLKHGNHDKHASSSTSSSSSSASSTTAGAAATTNNAQQSAAYENTNSLQRQRVSAYRDFQSVLSEPRRNHREFALSLTHLSHLAEIVADKDVFDEMHFQILATRRDVVNIIVRFVMLCAAIFLANV